MRKLFCCIVLLYGTTALGQGNINIVPMPASVKMGKGNFTISNKTVIVLEGGGLQKIAALFNEQLKAITGFALKIVPKSTTPNTITLNFERLDDPIAGAYNLTVDKTGIYIAGDNETGVFYGIQSLIQLLPIQTPAAEPPSIPYVNIEDHARFAYRGMHLDVGRHFFPVSFIKKYIDYLAAYKFNNFHWHLTEDQGWRIEIKRYPKLTQTGSCRDRTLVGRYGSNVYDSTKYCGYYTQEEVKEVVKYAADRYITVIPEIEMPGHSTAALASYPFLGCTKGPYKVMDTWGVLDDVYCAGNDSTYQFIENVLDEVIKLFPSKYIHIGGDECPKTRWQTCPVCQKRIHDEGLKDEHALQSYFIQRIEKYLNSKGRSIIGWDEILEGGLAPNATVMSWRGEEGGIAAAKQGHDVIMTPGSNCYFDHSQSKNEDSLTIGGYLPLETVYNYDPVPAVLDKTQAKHILGAQGNVWTEYISNTAKVEYMIFPRLCALSEVLWTPVANKSYADFERRLPVIFARLDAAKTNYSKAFYDLKGTVRSSDDHKGLTWQISNPVSKTAEIKIYRPGGMSEAGTPDQLLNSCNGDQCAIIIDRPGTYSAIVYHPNSDGKGFDESHPDSRITQKFFINKATGKKISLVNEPAKNYPGDGAFTLVNGIQNEKALARSSEFLGFLGKDLDATIDLGEGMGISEVRVHTFAQPGSWIYAPQSVIVQVSDDGINFENLAGQQQTMTRKGLYTIILSPGSSVLQKRYVRVIAKNYGIIPQGNPGAGNPAWLFADEIEIE